MSNIEEEIYFKDLSLDLKNLLIQLEKEKIIEINSNKTALYVHISNREKFLNSLSDLKFNDKREIKIKDFLINFYSQEDNVFRFPIIINIESSISTGDKIKKKEKKINGFHGDLQTHFSSKIESPGTANSIPIEEEPIENIIKRVNRGKELFKIWISTNKLDHRNIWSAKFDFRNPKENNLFKKIELGFNIRKYNTNSWAFPIKEEHGFLMKVHVSKPKNKQKGSVRVFLERNFNNEIIFQENYFKIFSFLNIIEHQQFLELLFYEKNNNPLFQVELANAVGPKKIIDEQFKKSCLNCYIENSIGSKSWIQVEIDYSLKTQPEIEIKGAKTPSENLREVITDALQYTNSVMGMHHSNQKKSELILRKINDVHQYLIQIKKDNFTKQDLESEFSEIQILIENIYTSQKIQNVQIIQLQNHYNKLFEQHLESRARELEQRYKELETIKIMGNNIESTILESNDRLGDLIKNKFDENNSDLLNGINSFIKNSENKIIDKINNTEKKLRETINKRQKRIHENLFLVKKIIRNFEETNIKNIIRSIQKEKQISKSTIYNYIKILQEKKQIIIKKKKQKRGRPFLKIKLRK